MALCCCVVGAGVGKEDGTDTFTEASWEGTRLGCELLDERCVVGLPVVLVGIAVSELVVVGKAEEVGCSLIWGDLDGAIVVSTSGVGKGPISGLVASIVGCSDVMVLGLGANDCVGEWGVSLRNVGFNDSNPCSLGLADGIWVELGADDTNRTDVGASDPVGDGLVGSDGDMSAGTRLGVPLEWVGNEDGGLGRGDVV